MSKKKKIGLAAALATATLMMTGCIQAWNHTVKNFESHNFGLNYHITLYSYSGTVLREWHTHSNIDGESENHCTFYDDKNNRVSINGCYVIEQE